MCSVPNPKKNLKNQMNNKMNEIDELLENENYSDADELIVIFKKDLKWMKENSTFSENELKIFNDKLQTYAEKIALVKE